MGAGKRDSLHAKQKVAKCVVGGDPMLCNDGAEHAGMMVESLLYALSKFYINIVKSIVTFEFVYK